MSVSQAISGGYPPALSPDTGLTGVQNLVCGTESGSGATLAGSLTTQDANLSDCLRGPVAHGRQFRCGLQILSGQARECGDIVLGTTAQTGSQIDRILSARSRKSKAKRDAELSLVKTC